MNGNTFWRSIVFVPSPPSYLLQLAVQIFRNAGVRAKHIVVRNLNQAGCNSQHQLSFVVAFSVYLLFSISEYVCLDWQSGQLVNIVGKDDRAGKGMPRGILRGSCASVFGRGGDGPAGGAPPPPLYPTVLPLHSTNWRFHPPTRL
jgi:hypothetical protein